MTTPAGYFVTGTDTGVGKTVVSCAVVRGLRERGLDVGAMKPIETGVGPEGPLDALALQAAADGVDALEDVCPQRFQLIVEPLRDMLVEVEFLVHGKPPGQPKRPVI